MNCLTDWSSAKHNLTMKRVMGLISSQCHFVLKRAFLPTAAAMWCASWYYLCPTMCFQFFNTRCLFVTAWYGFPLAFHAFLPHFVEWPRFIAEKFLTLLFIWKAAKHSNMGFVKLKFNKNLVLPSLYKIKH